MTSHDSHKCPTCGAALAQPQEPPAPERKPYTIEYHASLGMVRDFAPGENPEQVLQTARKAADGLKEQDFRPYDDAYRVRQIIVTDENGVEQAVWTDPDHLAQLHADDILELLEDMIETADDLSEARGELDTRISELTSCAEGAAIALKTMRREGGAQ